MQTRFNVARFVDDVGGVRKLASITDVPRTAPYRWIKTGRISTDIICRVIAHLPNIDINIYFEAEHEPRARNKNLQRGTRIR